jgi:ABC-type transport system substrate-binding protein
LKKIGINANIKGVDNSTYLSLRAAKDFDMLVATGTSYIPDPVGTLSYWGPASASGLFPVDDQNILDLLQKVEATLDSTERSGYVKQLETALVDFVPYVQLYWANETDAMRSNVQGYKKMIGLFCGLRRADAWIQS